MFAPTNIVILLLGTATCRYLNDCHGEQNEGPKSGACGMNRQHVYLQ